MSEGIPFDPGQGETVHAPTGGPTVTAPPPDTPTGAPSPYITESPKKGDTRAVGELGKIGMLLFILALIALGSLFNDLLNWFMRSVLGPLWPKTASKKPDGTVATQAISSILGPAAAKIDSELGVSFTALGQTTGMVSGFFIRVAESVYQVAATVAGLEHHTAGMAQGQAAIRASVRRVDQEARQAQARIAAAEKAADANSRAVHHQLTQLQEHVTNVLEPELDALRSQIPKLQKGATVSWDLLRKHEEALGIAGLAAGVSSALRMNGAGWIECEANKLLGKAVCNQGPDKIRKLLEGLLDIAAILDLCQIVGLITDVAESGAVTDILLGLTNGTQSLIECRGLTLAAPLNAGAPSLSPKLSPFAALAPVG